MVQWGIGVVHDGWWARVIPFLCDGLVCLFLGTPSEMVPVSVHVLVQVQVIVSAFA